MWNALGEFDDRISNDTVMDHSSQLVFPESPPHQMVLFYDENEPGTMNSVDYFIELNNFTYAPDVTNLSAAYNYTIDCEDGNTILKSSHFKSMVYIMYMTIFVLAFVGNTLVCYIVQATPRMRTVTNYFIVNLAIGDLLMAIFCIPFTSISTFILQYWPFGMMLCHFVNFFQATSVMVSAYTLVAISFDRYIAIMWPLKPRLSKRYACFIILLVWVFALLTASPIPLVTELSQPTEMFKVCDRYMCKEEWSTPEHEQYYSIALMALQYVVPLTVLIYTYTRIALVVWCKRIPGEAENTRDQRIARSKRKMIKMMVMVVIVFTLCWLPLNIFMVTDLSNLDWAGLPYLWFTLHWLAMSHSCYNPIIYCYMNGRFRIGFFQAIGRISCLRRYIPTEGQQPRSSLGFPLAGIDASENSVLHRANTCSTYISVRHKMGTNVPVSSSTVMKTTSGTTGAAGCCSLNRHSHRHNHSMCRRNTTQQRCSNSTTNGNNIPTAHFTSHRNIRRNNNNTSYSEEQI